MAATVKPARNFGIDRDLGRLRLQLVATELTRRVGQRLRARREELGLTQRAVAKRMASDAVDAQRISDWERGINKPSDRYLDELVVALEVDDVSFFYAEVESGPVDVLSALSGTQLDRIESMLAEVLRRLPEEGAVANVNPERQPSPSEVIEAAAAGAAERERRRQEGIAAGKPPRQTASARR